VPLHISLFGWTITAAIAVVAVLLGLRWIRGLFDNPPVSKVLIAGAFIPVSFAYDAPTSAEIYDPSSKSFSPTASLSTPPVGQTATFLQNDNVLFASAGAQFYQPRDQSFAGPIPLASARSSHTATLLPDGTVLIAGGFTASGPSASCEVYDPGPAPLGTFTIKFELNVARAGHTATTLKDGQILMTGGRDDQGNLATDSAELFDPKDGAIRPIGHVVADGSLDFHVMKNPRCFHTATLLSSGEVLIVGGLDSGRPQSRWFTGEIYDPTPSGEFPLGSFALVGIPDTRANLMTDGRAFHSATMLDNGNVLLAGGATVIALDAKGLQTADLYVPAEADPFNSPTGSFLEVPGGMTHARGGHAAVKLNDGTVLIAGGIDGLNVPSNDAELYDPTKGPSDPVQMGAFSADGVGVMNEVRFGPIATLLPPFI